MKLHQMGPRSCLQLLRCRYDACCYVDAEAEGDKSRYTRKWGHHVAPHLLLFYIWGFAPNFNCVWATVRPRSRTPRQALIS